MPDIEKRLEAFLRLAHGIVVFPGGVGTAEEVLYLLGVLLEPANASLPLPVVLTGSIVIAVSLALTPMLQAEVQPMVENAQPVTLLGLMLSESLRSMIPVVSTIRRVSRPTRVSNRT